MESDIRQDRDPRRAVRPPLARAATVVLLLLLLLVVAALGGLASEVGALPQQTPGASTTTAPAGATALPTITANSVVVVEQDPGQVSVIEGGKTRPIASGLSKPNGAAVLPDGGILVADSANNRLVGIGGRFGATLQEIVQVPFPEGVGVGADGSVYVTLLLAGEVGRVDLDAGTYTKVAGDLKGPGDVIVRNGTLVVTESTGGDVVEITTAGARSVVATGFQQPIGLTAGPGKSLFVADFKANKIVKVDDAGKTSDFATIDAPVQLASAPFVLTAETPVFAVVATGKEGLVVFDNTAKRVSTVAIKQATGVATGDVGAATTPTSTTTTTTGTSSSSAPGTSAVTPSTVGGGGTSSPSTPRTTRVRTSTTLPPLDDTPASSTGSILLFSLAVIVLALIALLMVFVVRRPKTMEKSGFEERPLDADSVADAFGPCAAEEVEVAEAEGARDAVIVQREATEKRQAAAEARLSQHRERLAEATATRRRIEDERKDAQENGPPTKEQLGSTEIKPEELGLTTEAGRDALAAFATGELDAHELEERWHELGEQQAIDVVREVGERRARLDPSKPWPDELRAIEAEERAAAELAESERDIEFAQDEIRRLNERENEVLARISAAHEALEACQERHRDARRAKATSAAAAAKADARSAGPAAPAAKPEPPADGDGPTDAAPADPAEPGPEGPGPAGGAPAPTGRAGGAPQDTPGDDAPGDDGPGDDAPGDDAAAEVAGESERQASDAATDDATDREPGAAAGAEPEGERAVAPEPEADTAVAPPPLPPTPPTAAASPSPAGDPADPTDAGAAAPAIAAEAAGDAVPDKPRIWGGRRAKQDAAAAAPPAAADAPAPDAASASAPEPEPEPEAEAEAEAPVVGTREEMLALIEAAKQSKREASERRAAAMKPKPADDDPADDA
jgi:sugar lactone lactonase YvrE